MWSKDIHAAGMEDATVKSSDTGGDGRPYTGAKRRHFNKCLLDQTTGVALAKLSAQRSGRY